MISKDFSHAILTVKMIFFSNIQWLKMFPEANKCQQKTCKNYPYNREDTMTKTIATHIRNISETFIGIFMGIPLGYTVYYHHDHY